MRSFASIAILAVGLLLAGCSWFEENANPPLEGERKPVLLAPTDSKASGELKPAAPAAPHAIFSWLQSNGSSMQTGYHASIAPQWAKVWETNIGGGESDRLKITARPIVAEGKIFAMDNEGRVTAMDAATGRTLWRVRTRNETGDALSGGLAAASGVLLVTNGMQELRALSMENGGQLWRTALDAPARSAPLVMGSRVYVTTRGGQSFALDITNGNIVWQHRGLMELAGILSGASPAGDETMVLMPYASGEVIALSPANGSVLWGENLSAMRSLNNLAIIRELRAPPMLLDDMVIAANYASHITALERRTGDRIWSHDFGALHAMIHSGNAIYFIATDGRLMAMDIKSGETFWQQSLLPTELEKGDVPPFWFGPLLLNGQVWVFSSEGRAVAFDAVTGNVTQQLEDMPKLAEMPIVAGDMIYLVTTDGDVVAFR